MKKRLEDKLIDLAFDEADGSISTSFTGSPEAGIRLNEYRKMRSELSQLRDLPDHQLSVERLREALLHQGLKRPYRFPWQSVGYGATACALFLGALFVTRTLRTPHVTPEVVDGKSMAVPQVAMTEKSPFNFLFSAPDSDAKSGAPSGAAHTARSHSVSRAFGANHGLLTEGVQNRASSGHNRLATFELNKKPAPGAPNGHLRNFTANSSFSNPGAITASTPAKDVIVMIQPNTDAATGLDTAMEVTGGNDVFVGG